VVAGTQVAGYWYDAAGAALWYRVAAFDDAERAAYQALQRAARGEWTRRDMLVLRGEIQDAQVEDDYQNRDLNRAVLQVAKGYNAVRKGKPYQERPAVAPRSPAPQTIKNQADLRWLLSQDWQWLMIQAAMLATARSAGADRHYLPWLSNALKRLRSTLPVAELEGRSPSNGGNDAAATSTINPRSSFSLNCCRAGSGSPLGQVGRVRPAGLPEWGQAGTPLGCSDVEPPLVGGGQVRCSLPRGEKSGRTRPVGHCNDAAVRGAAGGHHGAMTQRKGSAAGVGMTLLEIATAYAWIDKVWRSATRQSKKIHLVQLAPARHRRGGGPGLAAACGAGSGPRDPVAARADPSYRHGDHPLRSTTTTTLPLVGRSRVLGRPGRLAGGPSLQPFDQPPLSAGPTPRRCALAFR